jgi:ribonuclease BN (tRNA processing enzyme)
MMLHRQQPLHIYGPPGTKQILEGLLTACDVPHATGFGAKGGTLTHPRDFVVLREITPKDTFNIGDLRISCCENTHYRPEEEFGQEGPLSLSLRFDAPDRSIVFTGDTGPCEGLVAFARGAQLLVGELIDIEIVMERMVARNPNAPKARLAQLRHHMEAHHLTSDQLGEMASRAGVEQVVAVHIGFDAMNAETAPGYIAKIAGRYAGKIAIADDLDRF